MEPQKPATLIHFCQFTLLTSVFGRDQTSFDMYVGQEMPTTRNPCVITDQTLVADDDHFCFCRPRVISVTLGSMGQAGALPTSLPVCKCIFPLTSFSLFPSACFSVLRETPVVLPSRLPAEF